MPRAYCPECASEVPVDAEGMCHVGHRVDVAGASLGDAAGGPEAGDDADEPQPWVASVDPTTAGGYTPPPGGAPTATPDEGAWTPDEGPTPGGSSDVAGDAGDDLAAAAAAAVESLQSEAGDGVGPDPVEGTGQQVEAGWPETLPSEGDAPGWTPPTNDPVTPPPVPPPAPADPPAPVADHDADSDFDLDDLAAAVGDLDMDDDTPSTEPTAAATPTADLRPDADDDWEDELGEPPSDRPADATPPASGESVDLSNFTAKSGKVDTDKGGGGKKGGLFRRR